MLYIYSWNPHSESAKSLSKELGWPRIRHKGSRFKPDREKVILNWGASSMPEKMRVCEILNPPGSVKVATDKLAAYYQLQHFGGEIFLPFFTNDIKEAYLWMKENPGRTILARTVMNGHGGQGIHVVHKPEDLKAAFLYVEYVAKKEEYRVHVAGGETFLVQQKRRRRDVPDDEMDWRVRNYDNGFTYAIQNVQPPDEIIFSSASAVANLGLDFGAVDVGWNEKHKRSTVYEVNTAPGLEGSTIEAYVKALKKYVEEK